MARLSAFGISPIPGYPNSLYQVERFAGGSHSREAQYLIRTHPSADAFYRFFDFDDKALDTTNWWSVAAGAGATTWAVAAAANGVLRGITGATAATSGLQLQTALANFQGGLNPGFEMASRVDVVTAIRVESGFVNALPSINTKFTNSLTTPTVNTVADGAWNVYDHVTATYTTELITIGGAGTTPNKFVDAVQQLYVATTYTEGLPLAGSTRVTRLQMLKTGAATASAQTFVNGIPQGQSAVNSCDAPDALVWAISVQCNTDANTQNFDIDYVELWSDRASF